MAKYLSDITEGIRLNRKKSNKDYYIKRSYIILKSQSSDDFLVSKKVCDVTTNLTGEVDMMKIQKLHPKEDAFAAISSHCLMKGHPGAHLLGSQ